MKNRSFKKIEKTEFLLDKLKHIPGHSSEGNLLLHGLNADVSNKKIQVDFLTKYLKEINPEYVLETGTNLGCFSVLVKTVLPTAKVITFGIDNFSLTAVNVINKFYEDDFIEFILGDSMQTLTSFQNTTGKKIDFAWVDGLHSYEGAYSDLMNCGRLKIKNIFIDDVSLPQIKDAISDFQTTYSYEIIDVSKCIQNIAFLKEV
tara:strand:- start:2980 stop:3588 length:609 start_codon:yes stop_codon:yes gene_type:complete